MACAWNNWLATDVLGIAFRSCDADCTGAAATDALLALHALWASSRAWRLASASTAGFSRHAAWVTSCNCVWSAVGTLFWLQPAGERPAWFERAWRLNAICQAAVIFFHWNVTLDLLAAVSSRELPWLRRFSIVHSLLFAAVVALGECRFEHYVLFGGSNITFPMAPAWILLCYLCYSFKLFRRSDGRGDARKAAALHPICCGALAGFVFWVGNAGILLGRDAGPAAGIRCLLSSLVGRELPPRAWEEMATFHVFGLAGNALLFHCYEEISTIQVRLDQKQAKHASTAWLTVHLSQEREAHEKVS
ncbi:hypothetical protein AB1Y20_022703 [Prymnesium parvum]